MQNQTLRYPCVPLIAHDPMFSVWSFGDKLYDDVPRHWTGQRQFITGSIAIDGDLFQFMGKLQPDNARYMTEFPPLEQKSVEVKPLRTIYTFENEKIRLQLQFLSPLLPDDLMVLSRPISYISYKITALDGQDHEIHLFMGFSCEMAVNDPTQSVTMGQTALSLFCSSGQENMLKRSGDDHRIEWGSFHLIAPTWNRTFMPVRAFSNRIHKLYTDKNQPLNLMDYQSDLRGIQKIQYNRYDKVQVGDTWPVLTAEQKFTLQGEKEDFLAVGYDDICSIQYFEENIRAYWRKDGDSFLDIMRKALAEYPELCRRSIEFEDKLLAQARDMSPKFADILSLAYRQTVSAHKLTWHDGELQFFSKENYSNGCIATVDVTYPSIPLFLMVCPKLVEGMLNPIFKLVEKGLWEFPFAPHDVGQYPIANYQRYGYDTNDLIQGITFFRQMPVEECGNMILCVAAVCYAQKDLTYFLDHKDILLQWADYLVEAGFDPENQLCTDDFAGHLAHNCNLSIKAIVALGATAKLLEDCGFKAEAGIYRSTAEGFAKDWENAAREGDHTRLAFDQEDTWSIKYNIVWDNLLHLNLFSQEMKAREVESYKAHIHAYGLPLDSRADYTKSDWQMWSTVIAPDGEYFNLIVDRMWDFLNETYDRIPFSDWYFTSRPIERGFQARSVQGGLFLPLVNLD